MSLIFSDTLYALLHNFFGLIDREAIFIEKIFKFLYTRIEKDLASRAAALYCFSVVHSKFHNIGCNTYL